MLGKIISKNFLLKPEASIPVQIKILEILRLCSFLLVSATDLRSEASLLWPLDQGTNLLNCSPSILPGKLTLPRLHYLQQTFSCHSDKQTGFDIKDTLFDWLLSEIDVLLIDQ